VDHECRHDHGAPYDARRIARATQKAGRAREYFMKYFILNLVAVAVLSAVPDTQTFTGTIIDDICAKDGHDQMRMGPTDGECTIACIDVHGASYVLLDGKNIYELSDQQTPEKFAGNKVKVLGTLDAKSKKIQVDSITATQ
jgi:hypothetical protein